MKNNLVGGPSIVFHRYHEVGITQIRKVRYLGNDEWGIPNIGTNSSTSPLRGRLVKKS